MNDFTPDHLATARGFFERAVALDPANPFGLIGFAAADVVVALNFLPGDRDERLAGAEATLIKALSLAPDNAVAHLLLGVVQMHTDRISEGLRQCERALELDRNHAGAHAQIGNCKLLLGKAEETEAHIREALRLSPRDLQAYHWCMFSGLAKLFLGKDEEAIAWLRRSVETNRNFPSSHFFLAAALAQLGRLPEAQSETRAGFALYPAFTVARFRAGSSSVNSVYLAQRERVIDGLRKAGVPEQ